MSDGRIALTSSYRSHKHTRHTIANHTHTKMMKLLLNAMLFTLLSASTVMGYFSVQNGESVYNGACVSRRNRSRQRGRDYEPRPSWSLEECMKIATAKRGRFVGFGYSKEQGCELWINSRKGSFEKKTGYTCFWNTQDTFRLDY